LIFGDKSLQEMAYYFPQDNDAFSNISGVGAKKLEKFGEIFMNPITEFVQANGLITRSKSATTQDAPIIKVTLERPIFYLKTKELLIKKTTIDRIAKRLKLSPTTVINHIEKMIDDGEVVDLEYLKLPLNRYETMKKAFAACGDERLKPVFEYLDGEYDYDELKLARLLVRV
jgi:ATP-dependent DNA helicase RecQ